GAGELGGRFEQELNCPAVVRRAVEGSVGYIVIRDRNTKARAELGQLIFIELLLLMSDVAAFAGFAETVAFDRGRQDDRGRAFVIDGRVIGRVNLFRIMSTARKFANLLVGEMLDQRTRLRILADEMLAN